MASSAADDESGSVTERIARRDRAIVLASVAALALLAWGWLTANAAMTMTAGFAPVAAMWFIMMVAMMLPSAAPAILLYGRVRRSRGGAGIAPDWLFMSGYLLAWLGFSIVAAVAQLALAHGGRLESMALRVTVPALAGTVLIVAGAYQLSPWKDACLSQCRSPASFLSRHWRPGAAGAVRLGLFHGAQCIGCCWLLMALLFVGGVMNLVWIAALTIFVLIEKIAPSGAAIGKWSGALLLAWAGATLIA